MRTVLDIEPFENEFEIVTMPKVRVIGKEARCGGALGNTAPELAEETMFSSTYKVLENLPRALNYGCGWTCDYDAETDTFSYIVGFITPADTPVPEGFIYRDSPATLCARGLIGEDAGQTVKRAKELGYVTNWEECPWNAEFYIQEEEEAWTQPNLEPCHWLVPIKKA